MRNFKKIIIKIFLLLFLLLNYFGEVVFLSDIKKMYNLHEIIWWPGVCIVMVLSIAGPFAITAALSRDKKLSKSLFYSAFALTILLIIYYSLRPYHPMT